MTGFNLRIDDDLALGLRELRLVDPYFELASRNRERLSRWEPWAEQPGTLESTRAFLQQGMDQFAAGRQVPTVIWFGEELVGSCAAYIDSYSGGASLGYWIDERFEGRGIVSRSTAAMCAYVFESTPIHRIELRIAADNERSLAVAARLGFVHEGTLRQALKFRERNDDVAVFGLLREEWSIRATPPQSRPGPAPHPRTAR